MRDSAGFAPASLRLRRPGDMCPARASIPQYWQSRRCCARDPDDRERGRLAATCRTRTRRWLGQRLESLGVRIVLSAAVPDEVEAIADFVQRERDRVDHLLVTGGLGGTPDDLTREAVAAAFSVGQREVPAARRRAAGALPSPSRLRRAVGAASGRQPAALEPARRGARLRDRERLGLARAPVRDGGDVRPLCRRAARRPADRVVAPRVPDTRERDRPPARRRDRALAAGADRLLPAIPARRPRGRDRAQVGKRGEARRGSRLARARPRRRDGSSTFAVSRRKT